MRIVILICGLLGICLSIKAQSATTNRKKEEEKYWRNGFIITQKEDTIVGEVLVTPDRYKGYTEFVYKMSFKGPDGKVVKYKTENLKSFSFYYDLENRFDTVTYFSIDIPGEMDGVGLIFCRLLINGTCKAYSYIGMTSVTFSNSSQQLKKFIQMGDSDPLPIKLFEFKDEMERFFSKCPVIFANLDSKKYKYSNWEDIVKDFNSGVCK